MKHLLSLLLVLAVALSLCACRGNFGSVDLKDSIEIPEDGIIEQNTVFKIKNENAIAIFVATSGEFRYEWTVFGSDIRDAKAINLKVKLTKTAEGDIQVALLQTETFGFSASLSVHLNDTWNARSATAYADEQAFTTVSITGSQHTILNLNLDGTVNTFIIRPDQTSQEQLPAKKTELPDQENVQQAAGVTTRSETENIPTATSTKIAGETATTIKSAEQGVGTTEAEEVTQLVTEPTKPTGKEGKDKYHTDPIPEGKPNPVEPEDQEVDKGKSFICTFSIECSTILNNLNQLDPEKLEMLPSGGTILATTTITFYEGESVFDVLQRVCKEKRIHLESSWTPIYNSAYIEGIHNLYEFDCGALSGWMYRVNGWYPNYGCSRYQLKDGDIVEWRFTCDLGNDIGGGYAAGG